MVAVAAQGYEQVRPLAGHHLRAQGSKEDIPLISAFRGKLQLNVLRAAQLRYHILELLITCCCAALLLLHLIFVQELLYGRENVASKLHVYKYPQGFSGLGVGGYVLMVPFAPGEGE